MEIRITAPGLARKLRDILAKIRDRSDSFAGERDGEGIARITPVSGRLGGSLGDGLRAWRKAAPTDPCLAEDLESVNRADRAPRNRCGS